MNIKKISPNDNDKGSKVVRFHTNQLDFQNYTLEETNDRFKKVKENN